MSVDYNRKCAFISNVYNTLVKQLLIMISFILVSQTSFGEQYFNNWVFGMPLTSTFVSFLSELVILNFYNSLSDDWITIWLSIFTLSISNIVTLSTLYFPPEIVLLSLLTTTVMVVFLNYHGSTTDYDYSPYYSALLGLFLALSLSSIVGLWFGIYMDSLLTALVSASIFSLFIVVDTQQLVKDNTYVNIRNGHIVIAMSLFLDVVNLFLRVLHIIGRVTNNERKKKQN
jgi:FtsH-binding integral membrane protein